MTDIAIIREALTHGKGIYESLTHMKINNADDILYVYTNALAALDRIDKPKQSSVMSAEEFASMIIEKAYTSNTPFLTPVIKLIAERDEAIKNSLVNQKNMGCEVNK